MEQLAITVGALVRSPFTRRLCYTFHQSLSLHTLLLGLTVEVRGYANDSWHLLTFSIYLGCGGGECKSNFLKWC